MKKEVMSNSDVANTNELDASTLVYESNVTNSPIRALLEEICTDEEFSILRETLRLYCEEFKVH